MEVFGSVWSDLLVMHNYHVFISECQKVTVVGVEAACLLHACMLRACCVLAMYSL